MHRFCDPKGALAIVLAAWMLSGCALRNSVGPARRHVSPPENDGSAWQQVVGLEAATPIVVTLKSGQRIEGRLRTANSDGVTVVNDLLKDVTIARSEIKTVRMGGAAGLR